MVESGKEFCFILDLCTTVCVICRERENAFTVRVWLHLYFPNTFFSNILLRNYTLSEKCDIFKYNFVLFSMYRVLNNTLDPRDKMDVIFIYFFDLPDHVVMFRIKYMVSLIIGHGVIVVFQNLMIEPLILK